MAHSPYIEIRNMEINILKILSVAKIAFRIIASIEKETLIKKATVPCADKSGI